MTEPTDAELDAVLCKHWPAFSMQATLVRMWVRAAMRDAIAKWDTPPAEQQAAPKAAPAQQEWRFVLPGGKYTDKWESARIGDYNRGWNDYRKTAIAALNSVVWPARTSGSWVGASAWLRNNYQDYPNIASLCDAMLEAAAAWNTRTPQPTKAQAVAVPLTPEQIKDEASHHGFIGSTEMLVKFVRGIEAHHGIKGGQHG